MHSRAGLDRDEHDAGVPVPAARVAGSEGYRLNCVIRVVARATATVMTISRLLIYIPPSGVTQRLDPRPSILPCDD